MLEHWERLAEAQRIRQEIEAEFQEALAHLGREAAERVRRACDGIPANGLPTDHARRLR